MYRSTGCRRVPLPTAAGPPHPWFSLHPPSRASRDPNPLSLRLETALAPQPLTLDRGISPALRVHERGVRSETAVSRAPPGLMRVASICCREEECCCPHSGAAKKTEEPRRNAMPAHRGGG